MKFSPFVGREFVFETSFSLAVFSKTTKAEFAEQGSHSTGGVNTTVRNEGLVPLYGMC